MTALDPSPPTVLTEEECAAVRRDLAAALGCSQCGRPFSHPACGPTHALIAADPLRHRLIEPLLDDRVAAAVRANTETIVAGILRVAREAGQQR